MSRVDAITGGLIASLVFKKFRNKGRMRRPGSNCDIHSRVSAPVSAEALFEKLHQQFIELA
jgi:hypothetical protein